MTVQPLLIAEIAIIAMLFFGLTRDSKTQPWGKPLAIGAFAAGTLLLVLLPDTGCFIAWDGLSNPMICD